MPSKPTNNSRDGALVDAIVASYRCIRETVNFRCSDDGKNIVVREFPIEVRLNASTNGVGVIFKSGNPFEVFDGVIRLVAVKVVDLWKSFWVRNEGASDEAVDRGVLGNRIVSKVDVAVVSYSDHNLHLSPGIFPNSISGPSAAPDSIKASNFSLIADLVKASESLSRYWSPLFCHVANSDGVLLASFGMALNENQGGIKCQ